MAKYIPDISTRRWVIVSTVRNNRPDETDDSPEEKKNEGACPFCPGNEYLTPKETYRLGGGEPDQKGWDVRVIPNKYPITDFHEVIIHSPGEEDLHEMELSKLEKVLKVYRHRFNAYKEKGQVIVFCNRGEHAGASIDHPHSQLVVLPKQINLSTLVREPLNNIIEENTHFRIYCPDFSQWPYEVWIAPKEENTQYGDITDEQIEDLATIYQKILKRLEKLHGKHARTGRGFSYNFYIYPKEKWYLRIIPRFVYRAGFELGTGLSVNTTDPEDAAAELRGDKSEMFNGELKNRDRKSVKLEPKDEIEMLKGRLAKLGVG